MLVTQPALDAPTSLTADTLEERVGALVPLLRANTKQVEEQARISDENLRALTATGFYEMNRPTQYGGLETPLTEQVEVLLQLARGCGSTAWVASTGAFCTWLVAQFADEAQAEVFADAEARVCGTFTPSGSARRVDGGFLVSGSWPYNTGCLHATWDFVPAQLALEDGSTEIIAALVPMADLEIEMVWDVDGLAGTGSNTTTGRDVFVPEHRTVRFADVVAGRIRSRANADKVLFRAPGIPTMMTSTAVLAGMARGALELFLERLPGRAITYTKYADQSAAQVTQLQVAEAQTKIELAEGLVRRIAESVRSAAEEAAR